MANCCIVPHETHKRLELSNFKGADGKGWGKKKGAIEMNCLAPQVNALECFSLNFAGAGESKQESLPTMFFVLWVLCCAVCQELPLRHQTHHSPENC